MHVIICGTRHRALMPGEAAWLALMHYDEPLGVVVTGGAPGIDTSADHWASDQGIVRVIFPANWQGDGRSAGPRRNRRMAAYLCAHDRPRVLAFPGGVGTRNMISTAEAMAIPVLYAPTWETPRQQSAL